MSDEEREDLYRGVMLLTGLSREEIDELGGIR